jgi:peroxiredoxin
MKDFSSKIELRCSTVFLASFIIGILFLLNIVLVVKNQTYANAKNVEPKVGMKMSHFSGFNENGEEISFEWEKDKRKTLVLAFSPKCGFCKKNMVNWEAILKDIDRTKFRPFLVSSLSTNVKEYLESYKIENVPVIFQPDPKLIAEYAMYMTPQTILLDSGGKVEKNWIGDIQSEQKSEIEQTLEVKLP